ncbi:MAG TPA: hypothetical protein VND64_19555, partial [Pirellulales bacterium]|nr:hypothetical protein [Pirellulales bacterium]
GSERKWESEARIRPGLLAFNHRSTGASPAVAGTLRAQPFQDHLWAVLVVKNRRFFSGQGGKCSPLEGNPRNGSGGPTSSGNHVEKPAQR